MAQLDDYDLKICAYADLRVAPHGIVEIQERFEDLRKRYQDTPLMKRYDGAVEEAALLIESQIFKHINFPDHLHTFFAKRQSS